jgi:rare lipoprotein A
MGKYSILMSDVLFEELILLKKLLFSTLLICAGATPALATCGIASYYESGTITASGAAFNPYGNTIAHNSYPFGTRLKIVNQRNGKIAYGVVRDRGGFNELGREMDMSLGLFQQIENTSRGVARVCFYPI